MRFEYCKIQGCGGCSESKAYKVSLEVCKGEISYHLDDVKLAKRRLMGQIVGTMIDSRCIPRWC
jgi:hypothetical protein